MTWVIGASSLFGYGVMISDVCVTFASGQTRDMLKKAYPVGPYILAGFAGSIAIGFEILASLQDFLALPDDAPENVAWRPEWVAENWASVAKGVFTKAPAIEQSLQSQILLVGLSPDQDMGAPQFRRVYIVRFTSPDFRPGFMRRGFTLCHIGSGGGVDRYKRALKQQFRLGAGSLQAELGDSDAWAYLLSSIVNRVTDRHPVPGVSGHVNFLVARGSRLFEGNNDERVWPADGSDPTEFKMPPLATSYADFCRQCGALGVASSGAVA